MANDWEEAADYLETRRGAVGTFQSLLTPDASALAAFALTVVSLFVVGAGNAIAESASFSFNGSNNVLAVVPGIQALVAALGLWLARVALRSTSDTAAWTPNLARASVLVGGISLMLNLAAMGYALS